MKFAPHNSFASLGGMPRAAKLTPERRSEIARAGWLAMVAKYYGGDATAAGRAIARKANGDDAIFYGHTFKEA